MEIRNTQVDPVPSSDPTPLDKLKLEKDIQELLDMIQKLGLIDGEDVNAKINACNAIRKKIQELTKDSERVFPADLAREFPAFLRDFTREIESKIEAYLRNQDAFSWYNFVSQLGNAYGNLALLQQCLDRRASFPDPQKVQALLDLEALKFYGCILNNPNTPKTFGRYLVGSMSLIVREDLARLDTSSFSPQQIHGLEVIKEAWQHLPKPDPDKDSVSRFVRECMVVLADFFPSL